MLEIVQGVGLEAFDLLARMAPYLILGIVVAGALHVVLPTGTVARMLGRPGIGSVIKASAVGVPLPLCSCGVVPVAASLKQSGASGGAVVSFLVSTPTTGVDSFLATYSLLGLPIAVIRVLASLVLGIVSGALTMLGLGSSEAEAPTQSSAQSEPIPRGSRLARGLSYGFDELMGGIARPLLLGTLLGGAIAYFLPAGVLEDYVGQGVISYLVMMAVGIPLYVCASGSIPLAAALLAKGISPGAALVFLIAGPATNMATVSVVSKMVGGRALVIYLVAIAAGSLGVGAATDAFFGAFPSLMPALSDVHGHEHSALTWFEIASGAALGGLTLFHVGRPIVGWARAKLRRDDDDRFVVTVPDMNCQHCASTVRGAVCDLPGVRGVEADPASKKVAFDLTDKADTEQIVGAIEKAGFKPVADRG